MKLPERIRALVAAEAFRLDDIGKSGSSVLLFSDKVLKIRPISEDTESERKLMTWLDGKLPVPKLLACEQLDGLDYLLMSRCPGQMACAKRYMEDPREQVRLLAEGLRLLWSVDITGCPVDRRLEAKLAQAQYRVEHGLVDVEDAQPDTFGEGGFSGPGELLRWLREHQPEEEPVLSHGDYCLPNIFLGDGEVKGFIDLGRCGAADKWCDIALCFRSLSNNYSGCFGRAYPGLDGARLFQELGLEPDWEKLRYYTLLDELF